MQKYSVIFRTDADYATHDFDARSPKDALKKARAFYDKRCEELMFAEHVGGHPVNEIAVRDPDGNAIALWRDDELRLRLAAGDLLTRLQFIADEIDKGADDKAAWLRLARAAIARAKGGAASRTHRPRQLPPDPDNMNADRAESAAVALRQFQCTTGSDYDDAPADLLCDLMHWSDRETFDFDAALCRARDHYEAETAGGEP